MMFMMSLSQVALESGGDLSGDAQFSNVCTDTRELRKGDLFIALSGENFDGSEFVKQAVDLGAVAIITQHKPDSDIPYLLVDDPRWVFGLIARANRRQYNGPLIALTGSTGKTTTKEMLAAILAETGAVLATQGNFNNEIGVPKTLMQITPEHQNAVIEMGAGRAGDIRYLCQFAEPTISLVTNAMPAHIESFGSLETIASTKGEVFECVSTDGVAVINFDDQFATQWQAQAGGRQTVTFSTTNNAADIYADQVQLTSDSSLKFIVHTAESEEQIELFLLGFHNVANALAACGAAMAAGANLQQVTAGLAKVRPVAGRLQALTTVSGGLVIDDSYNANPGSVKAAIDVLADCSKISTSPGSTCLVLGTMLELGKQAPQLHQEVAIYAREKGIDRLVAVGEYASLMMTSFAGTGAVFNQIDELLLELEKHTRTDIVLVKGSRSAHMERVVNALMSDTSVV